MRTVNSLSSDTRDEVKDAKPHSKGESKDHHRRWRLLAILLGLIAAGCALAFPFLPITQDTAKIVWPNGTDTRQVNAPLTGYWAQELRIDLPCATVQSLDGRTTGPAVLFSSIPAASTSDGVGLQLSVDNGVLTASSRGQQVAKQQLPAAGCDIKVFSDVYRSSITVASTPIYHAAGDVRPRIVGIYTDITAASDPIAGLGVSITPDTRYQTTATTWKVIIGFVGLGAMIGCLIAVSRLDTRVARRAPRWAPVGWWRLTGRDITVIAVLGAWIFIGPVTSDDGYILTMARVADDAGYLTNYHRWFGVAEAPFGWFYYVYELMAQVGTAPPWIRLPSFLLGVLSWLLISREVMPRLGSQIRVSKAAGWAAAAVFLVWWLPYNNGVRPEPVAAVGSLLAICAVERALVTRRLLPLCLGLIAATLTLAATPTGLIAIAPFLVAARPLFHLLRARARDSWLAVLTPILGAGLMVLIVVFADQTFATVQEATRLRAVVGPSLSWFEELARYELLFSTSVDGSVSRRFPVLLLILCTVACLVVLLRRGRIPGAALGPSRRLIGTVALFFLLLALTPTKWTHHFGAFAAVGASMAALTALACSATVLRSRRNQAMFLSGLLAVAALAATGPNSYWFVSNLGVPWQGQPIFIAGKGLSTLLLVAAAIFAIIAFIENVRAPRPVTTLPTQERRRRSLKWGSLSLVVVCGLVVVGEFASMAKAISKQRDSYSLGAANIAHVFGGGCNLSDHVMVEKDPVASVLRPVQIATLAAPPQQNGESPLPTAQEDIQSTRVGFHTEAIADDDPLADPPHGFATSTVPMWSSYQEKETPVGRLRTPWYTLADRQSESQVVVSLAAGSKKATAVSLEFATRTPTGAKIIRRQQILAPGAGSKSWADIRIALRTLPPEAELIRIVAEDNDITKDGWVAVTAPRVPSFTSLTERVGNTPVYMEWPTAFVYPCVQPMLTRDGIAEMPAYRLTAGSLAYEANWAGSAVGGPNGWLEEIAKQPEVPSYLIGAPGQSWGKLNKVEPLVDGVAPTVIRGQEVHSGWWSPGPGPQQPNGAATTR